MNTHSHDLWVIARPGTVHEVIFALGNTAKSAWWNALCVLHGDVTDESVFNRHKSKLQREGWRARKAILSVEER